ncbi:MAG: hypothetical protein C0177_01425 [Fervidicoccus fontis]|jgi:hypothetical protein|nr:MAG: hypothetical protein C0177_01425 [Fervidicoccus fontis]
MGTSEEEIPLARRLIDWNGTIAVSLPKFWIKVVEAESGKQLKWVIMRVSKNKIVITPCFDEGLAKKLGYRK